MSGARQRNPLTASSLYPMNYVTNVCIQKSMALLVRIEESIERIAETVGYGTGFALSKAFKRIAGVSPQHYRLQASG